MPPKRAAIKKSPAKAAAAVKKTVATKKSAPRKATAAKKSPTSKAAAVKKAPAKKGGAIQKSPAKATVVKKSPSKATTVKKSPAKATAAKKSPAKKGGALKKSPAKKAPAGQKKAEAPMKQPAGGDKAAKGALPTFRYHPNLLKSTGGTGAMEPNGEKSKCDVCSATPKFIYTGPVYHTGEDNPTLCAPCIASGAAAAKFKCTFSGAQFVGKCSNAASKKELFERTPGFNFYNEGEWPVHCNEPCAFLGLAPQSEIDQLVMETKTTGGWKNVALRFPGETSDSSDRLVDSAPDGDIALVQYQCLTCSIKQYTFDMS